MSSQVREQYESWPYPSIPRVATLSRDSLWQIHLDWIRTRCGITPLKTQPSIWIAGCGTFEPYVFAQANPGAKILATDISKKSMDIAKRRLKWHRISNAYFQQLDLSDLNSYPQENFDFIECYGVLMCLPEPLAALKSLASRLKPDGVLRIMVYPHYSRQRIFQIQRLAKLLGLSFTEPEHPALLRSIMRKLPKSHPLSYAFKSYWDAKNLPGIVDGFLHASDRGFTGIELCQMLDEAGLTPNFCFHRPWGQPSIMAEKLSGLGEHSFSFWLHYLDLWQSLRTNFTLCLTKKERTQTTDFETEKHPLFNLKNPDLSLLYKAKLLSMTVTGGRFPSRTAEAPIKLSGKNLNNLLQGKSSPDSAESEILLTPQKEFLDFPIREKLESVKPRKHFIPRLSDRVLNPLYDYLFDAYTFHEQTQSLLAQALPNLESQIRLWEGHAYPLEDSLHPFGLTPYGTYFHQPDEIQAYSASYLKAEESSFFDFQLKNESVAFNQVKRFLKDNHIMKLADESQAVLRQLWILLFSYDRLFLEP